MNFKGKEKLVTIIEKIHLRIFGHEMSDEMRKFLDNLSWSFFGGVISMSIFFVINIMAGRILGPEGYGEYSLIIAIVAIFSIPMVLGMDTSATYHIARAKKINNKRENFNSTIWMVLPLIIIVSIIILIVSPLIAELFTIKIFTVQVSVIFGVLFAFKNVFDSFIKGFHLFKFQANAKIFEAVIVLIAFFSVVSTSMFANAYVYVGIVGIGYLFFIVISVFKFREYFQFSLLHRKKIFLYGIYAVIGAVSGILLYSVDKILINKYIGSEQLGVYNAYFTVSILVVGQFVTMLINVLFPFLSSIDDKSQIFKKLNKLTKILILPVFVVLIIMIWIMIFLFGDQYPFDGLLTVEFGLLSIVVIYFSILWWLIASKSINGIKFTSVNGVIAGLIFVVLVMTFRNVLNLYYVVLFLTVAIFYAIIAGNLKYEKIK